MSGHIYEESHGRSSASRPALSPPGHLDPGLPGMSSVWKNCAKRRMLVLLLYAGIALALLAPSASDNVVPASLDLGDHLGAIVQAGMALQDGQFPPRIAPWQHNGWQYPVFQFYSSLPFTLAGLVYQWLTPNNPWVAFKIVIGLGLIIAGVFTYRLATWLTGSRPAGLLAGAIYMSAPYFLINIHARGNFTESVAQGILPPVLYYSVRCFAAPKLRPFVGAAVCWSALATAHIITFLYGSLFFGLWLLLVPGRPRRRLGRLIRFGAAYSCGLLLALYFLAPALSADYLVIRDRFYLPYDLNWLTPLPTLLSPVSLPSEPQPGQLSTPNLHPAVGWPMLLGAATVLYTLVAQPSVIRRRGATRFMWALLAVFALSLFATWSPIDFWSTLPQPFHVVQFPYRLLSQVMWPGSLLAAYALQLTFRGGLDQRHVAIGLLLVGLASSTWLPIQKPNNKKLADFVREPSISVGKDDYLIRQRSNWLRDVTTAGVELPFGDVGTSDNTLKRGREVNIAALMRDRSRPIVLRLVGDVPPQPDGQMVGLSAMLDGNSIASTELGPGPFTWEVQLRRPLRALNADEIGNTIGLKLETERISLEAGAVEQVPKGDPPSLRLDSAVIHGLPAERTALPVTATQEGCTRAALVTTCQVSVSEYTNLVQVPVLFYPGLLDAQVDGQSAQYVPLTYKGYVLVGLRVPPGDHRISVRFEGFAWANRISGVAWLCVAVLLVTSIIPFSTLRRRVLRPRWGRQLLGQVSGSGN
jgi:hypothetical protein